MSDALQRLIDAVEAGTLTGETPHADLPCDVLHLLGAYAGSLDAAKSMHDALLPGWWWAKEPEGLGGTVSVGCPDVRPSDSNPAFAEADNPARAWLLAILRAYQQVQQ